MEQVLAFITSAQNTLYVLMHTLCHKLLIQASVAAKSRYVNVLE